MKDVLHGKDSTLMVHFDDNEVYNLAGMAEEGPADVRDYWDEDAKKWVGGKFEWTDESRSFRSCQNIYEGYGGWEAAAWEYAKKRAFCVVSADGKYRSNLLED